jgi:polygalacturonase
MSEYTQLSDFAATEVVTGTDLIYSANAETDVEQATTVKQLQNFVLSPIAASTSTDAGTLLDTDTVPMGRAGLYQTTWAKLKAYVLAAIANGTSTSAGTLSGNEIVPVSRGSGLLQTTTGAIAALVGSNMAPLRESIPVVSANQASYVTSGYTPGCIDVFVAGIRISPSGYQATDGVHVVITDPNVLANLTTGMNVDIDATLAVTVQNVATLGSVLALDPANQPAVGTLTGAELMSVKQSGAFFQSTLTKIAQFVMSLLAPQTQSIPVTANSQASYVTNGYSPGLINVFITGIRLNPSQYQATDGVHVVITDSAVLAKLITGMTVDIAASVGLTVSNVATVASVNALSPSNQPAAATLSGTEQVSMLQGSGLVQGTLTKIAQWLIGTYQGFTQSGSGALARTIQSKLQDNVSVLDFGAVGDGVTNNTAAFAAAIAYQSANSASQVLRIPKGVFVVGQLTIPSTGLIIIGEGADSQLIVSAHDQVSIISAVACSLFEVHNLRLTGDGTALSNTGYGLYISQINDVVLDNLWVDGFGNNSIFFDNSTAITASLRPYLGTIKCMNAQNALGSTAENAAINFYGPWQYIHLKDILIQASATNPIQNGFNISEISTNNLGWSHLTIDDIRVYGVGKRGVSLDNELPTGTFSSGIVKIGNLHVESTGWEGFKSKNVDVIQIANGMALNCETNGPEIAGNLQGSFFFNGPNDVQARLVVQGGATDAVRIAGRAVGTAAGVGRARWQLDILSSNNGTPTYGGCALTVQTDTQSIDARVQSYYDNNGISVISSAGNVAPLSIRLKPTIYNAVNNGINLAGIAGLPLGSVYIEQPDISNCGQFGVVATYCQRLEIAGGNVVDSGQSSVTNNAGIRVANINSLSVHDVYSNNLNYTTQAYGLSMGSGIVMAHVHDNDFSSNTTGAVSFVAPTTLRAHDNHGWFDEGTGYYGDTSVALTFGSAHPTTVFNVALTAARNVTFVSAGAPYGYRLRIVYAPSTSSTFNLSVVGTQATKVLSQGQWCDMEWIQGASGWTEVASGSL